MAVDGIGSATMAVDVIVCGDGISHNSIGSRILEKASE